MKKQLTPAFTMEYEDAGKGDPVVLIHGFPLTQAMWRPQVEALSASHRILAPTMRGFGGTSGFEAAPGVELMADDVAALLSALGIERVVLGGLSMGGYVTMAFARKYPERLRGLFLADTRAEADTTEARANRDKMIAFAQDHSASEVLEQMLPKLVGETTQTSRPEVMAEIRKIAAAQSPAGIIGALQALRDRPDALAGLAKVRVPALVIVGEEDSLTPPPMAETMAKTLRSAQVVRIPAAGHMSNLEQPAVFTDALRTFLAALR